MLNSPEKEKVLIHLGVDFGTSFTKVCYRIRGRGFNQVKPAPFSFENLAPGMVPSIVYEGPDGRLSHPLERAVSRDDTVHRYLKMRLTRLWTSSLKESSGLTHKIVAVFFLAELLQRTRTAIEEAEEARIDGKIVTWTVKICLPLGNNDRSLIDYFNQIYQSAWALSEVPIPNSQLDLEETIIQLNRSEAPRHCQGYPELTAAVHSFLQSREARPGLYCYFDIGGGTLDGAAFHLKQDAEGPRHIYIYRNSVTPHGMASICERAGIKADDEIHSEETRLSVDKALIANGRLGKEEEAIRQIVASIVVSMRDLAWEDNTWALYYGEYSVYLGGGGSKSRWYRRVMEGAAGRWGSDDGLKKYFSFKDCTVPDELSLDRRWDSERHRYAVAHGLSTPLGEELPIHGFPWEYDPDRITDTTIIDDTVKSPISTDSPAIMNRPCICGGRNPDCEFCGGWGDIGPMSEHRGRSTSSPDIPLDNGIIKEAQSRKAVRILLKPKRTTGRSVDQANAQSQLGTQNPPLLVINHETKEKIDIKNHNSRSDRVYRFIYDILKQKIKYTHLKHCIICYAPVNHGKLLNHLEEKHADLVIIVKKNIESEKAPVIGQSTTHSEVMKDTIEKKVEIGTKGTDEEHYPPPRVINVKAVTPAPKPDLQILVNLVKKLGIRYENNRNMGGGFWVYCDAATFEPLKHELDKLSIVYKHYPTGRRLRFGEQYELDPNKILK